MATFTKIFGTGAADHLLGTALNEIIFGRGGDDELRGGGGLDIILGGGGADTLFGDFGNDILLGGNGDDALHGGDGDDKLIAGAGDDIMSGGGGNDQMEGGAGSDTYVISTAAPTDDIITDIGRVDDVDKVQLGGFFSIDQLLHGIDLELSGDDLIVTYHNDTGQTGTLTLIDQLTGGGIEEIEIATGQSTSMTFHIAFIEGDKHTYSVHGGADKGGEDIVLGTTGDDEIYAGLGSNIVLGGGGADIFIFETEGAGNIRNDIILDFDPTDDILDFTRTSVTGIDSFVLSETAAGNALISLGLGTIELAGVSIAQVTADIFEFA
ncbi:MAG: hypothetical protein JKX69_02330 [Rhodobacteraceae bacterium]|nr:hypothetical protein [Paracoccaceae bacterium]